MNDHRPMKDTDEKQIVVCISVAGRMTPAEGSMILKCGLCGCDIWYHLTTATALPDPSKETLRICTSCFVKNKPSEFKVNPPSKVQMDFLKEKVKRRKNGR